MELDSPRSQAAANRPPFIGLGSSAVHGHQYAGLEPHVDECTITAKDLRPFYLHCFPKCATIPFSAAFLVSLSTCTFGRLTLTSGYFWFLSFQTLQKNSINIARGFRKTLKITYAF
jgi:hypothetical protein